MVFIQNIVLQFFAVTNITVAKVILKNLGIYNEEYNFILMKPKEKIHGYYQLNYRVY